MTSTFIDFFSNTIPFYLRVDSLDIPEQDFTTGSSNVVVIHQASDWGGETGFGPAQAKTHKDSQGNRKQAKQDRIQA